MTDYFTGRGEEILYWLNVIYDGQVKEAALGMITEMGSELEAAMEAVESDVE